jgi:uncharacterized membrane protein
MPMNLSRFFHTLSTKLHLNFAGTCMGLLFFSASFTPSLLARGPIVQGVLSGLSLATGYAIGTVLSYLYHRIFRGHAWKISLIAKRITVIFLFVAALILVIAGLHWQTEIRTLTAAAPLSGLYIIPAVIIAVILWLVILWIARGMRHLGRYFGRKLSPHVSSQVARYGGGLIAAIVIVVLVNGVLINAVFGIINYSFGLANKGTPDGIHQPQNSILSGSPTSAIDWNTLGEKGREFVASGPAASAVAAYSSPGSSMQPSRLYVGLESAPTLEERVALLVKELDRTHASERQAVLIAIPTGSGGVNAKAVESVEYLYGGSTATLGIQYSYLPSWLSFVADQETARETGRQVTEAVYDWWNHLNSDKRPKLLMYGESLGTLGADGAFSGPADMHNRMGGVLLAGPPHANHLWQNIVADRDPGSREVLPIYQKGEIVRFTDGVTSLPANPAKDTWKNNRVGIIQHGSDPVVWASTSLFWKKPDWLREPRGSDVLANMRWYPFVTGWQAALDLPFAFGATPGHGHRYGNSLVDSWISVLNMRLSPDKHAHLQQIIDNVKG